MSWLASQTSRRGSRRTPAPGFEVTDRELRKTGPEWLEYRRSEAAGGVLLGIAAAREHRTVTAKLSRPERLSAVHRGAALERAAERYATWHDGPEVVARVTGLGRPGCGLGVGR
jgi:hypothetical protein